MPTQLPAASLGRPPLRRRGGDLLICCVMLQYRLTADHVTFYNVTFIFFLPVHFTYIFSIASTLLPIFLRRFLYYRTSFSLIFGFICVDFCAVCFGLAATTSNNRRIFYNMPPRTGKCSLRLQYTRCL